MNYIVLIAALAPVAFMLHFVYVRDKHEPEALQNVALVFFASFVTVIPAALFEMLFQIPPEFGLFGIALSVWGVIAVSEETVKLWAVRLLAFKKPFFNEVYDGIIYCVAASLGFATVENILYVYFAGDDFIMVALLRALFAIPGHALWGVMMGYYIGLAKFETDPRKARRLWWQGWGIAVFWHGLYDFCAFGAEAIERLAGVFIAGLIAVVIVNWWLGIRYIRKAQALSAFKRPNPLVNPVQAFNLRAKFCHQCGRANKLDNEFCVRCDYRFPAG